MFKFSETFIMFKVAKFFIFFILFSHFVNAQSSSIDSLNSVLKTINMKKEPQKYLVVVEKLYEKSYQSNPLGAIEMIGKAIFITDSIIFDSTLSIKWKEKLGKIYLSLEKYDQAMRYFVVTRDFYEKQKDSINYAYSVFYLGKIYAALNVPEIANREFDKCARIFNSYNDHTGIVLVNIEKSYLLYKDYEPEKAFSSLFNLLKTESKNDYFNAQILKTIGDLYAQDFQSDSSVYFLEKAVKSYSKINDQINIADCYLLEGNVFLDEEYYDKANEKFQKALLIFQKNMIDQKIAETLNSIGVFYFYQKTFDKAEQSFNKSLKFSEAQGNLDQMLISYDYFAKIYNEQKEFEKSNFYLNKYIQTQKISFQKKAEQGFAEIILNFQNEENQKEIELFEKEDALKSQLLKNKQQQVYGSVILVIILIIFAFILYFYLQRQKNLNKLLQEQNRQINLQKKELESQSKILEKATRDLINQKDKILNQNTKITSSIRYASRIQKAMLPGEEIFSKYFSNSFILYKPKETVSGDFYWVSEIREQKPSLFKSDPGDNKIVVAVVDCTGHGVPGAFMSMLGDAYLNQIINIQHIIEPAKILSELHKIIRKTLQQEFSENNDGMDLALCVIDRKEKTLKFSGAKNPLVYIQNGKMNRIQGDLMSIGGLQKETERVFKTHTIDITVKTTIFLYSDGFQDQFGGEFGRKYMAQPFRDLLLNNSTLDYVEQKERLQNELKLWRGKKHQQMDDITIIGFEI